MSATKVTARANDLPSALRKAVSDFVDDDDVTVDVHLADDVDVRDVKVKLSGTVTLRTDDHADVEDDVDDAPGDDDADDDGDGDEAVVAADADEVADATEDDFVNEAAADEDAVDHGDQLDREVDVAADFVEGILDAMDLPGELALRLNDAEQSAEVEVVDMDTGVLIGRRGSTLQAIQELMRCALQSQFDRRVKITVDIEGYRARRLEKFLDKADEAIDDVLDTGDAVKLEPMDVFERKAVHELVNTVEGISSRSQGREPSRRVVIQVAED